MKIVNDYQKLSIRAKNLEILMDGIKYINGLEINIFDLKNRVLYGDEVKIEDMDDKLLDLYLDQMFDQDKFPTKSELDNRVRFGELIYVDSYMRSDGTQVSGYYRAYPR